MMGIKKLSFVIVLILTVWGGVLYNKNVSANYALLSYTDAFSKLNGYLSEHYALKDWKKINFEEKYNTYLPMFKAAEEHKSKSEYYIALNKYLASFNDGHMDVTSIKKIITGKQSEFESNTRASIKHYDYGFTLAKTDDGKYLATFVDQGSYAAGQGLKSGYQITKINGIETQKFVETYEIPVWYLKFPNRENENFVKSFYLATTLGKDISINFIDPKKGEEKNFQIKDSSVSSRSYGDVFNCLYGIERFKTSENFKSVLLENGHGYLLIKSFNIKDFDTVVKNVKEKISELNKLGAKDLIIDIRNNGGGYDDLGAAITGLFTDKNEFYLNEEMYDSASKSYQVRRTINTTAQNVGFRGPIVVLFNWNTISAGEGFAYNLGKLEQVKTAGFSNTNGSFGTIEAGIVMPESFVVLYPGIVCTDANGKVLIDSDEKRVGGVTPDIKIPMDGKAVKAIFEDQVDYELEFVKEYLEMNR